MGLLLSILVGCVGVVELLAFYHNLERNLTAYGEDDDGDALPGLRLRYARQLELRPPPDVGGRTSPRWSCRLVHEQNHVCMGATPCCPKNKITLVKSSTGEDVEVEFDENVVQIRSRSGSPKRLLLTGRPESPSVSSGRLQAEEEPQESRDSKRRSPIPEYLVSEGRNRVGDDEGKSSDFVANEDGLWFETPGQKVTKRESETQRNDAFVVEDDKAKSSEFPLPQSFVVSEDGRWFETPEKKVKRESEMQENYAFVVEDDKGKSSESPLSQSFVVSEDGRWFETPGKKVKRESETQENYAFVVEDDEGKSSESPLPQSFVVSEDGRWFETPGKKIAERASEEQENDVFFVGDEKGKSSEYPLPQSFVVTEDGGWFETPGKEVTHEPSETRANDAFVLRNEESKSSEFPLPQPSMVTEDERWYETPGKMLTKTAPETQENNASVVEDKAGNSSEFTLPQPFVVTEDGRSFETPGKKVTKGASETQENDATSSTTAIDGHHKLRVTTEQPTSLSQKAVVVDGPQVVETGKLSEFNATANDEAIVTAQVIETDKFSELEANENGDQVWGINKESDSQSRLNPVEDVKLCETQIDNTSAEGLDSKAVPNDHQSLMSKDQGIINTGDNKVYASSSLQKMMSPENENSPEDINRNIPENTNTASSKPEELMSPEHENSLETHKDTNMSPQVNKKFAPNEPKKMMWSEHETLPKAQEVNISSKELQLTAIPDTCPLVKNEETKSTEDDNTSCTSSLPQEMVPSNNEKLVPYKDTISAKAPDTKSVPNGSSTFIANQGNRSTEGEIISELNRPQHLVSPEEAGDGLGRHASVSSVQTELKAALNDSQTVTVRVQEAQKNESSKFSQPSKSAFAENEKLVDTLRENSCELIPECTTAPNGALEGVIKEHENETVLVTERHKQVNSDDEPLMRNYTGNIDTMPNGNQELVSQVQENKKSVESTQAHQSSIVANVDPFLQTNIENVAIRNSELQNSAKIAEVCIAQENNDASSFPVLKLLLTEKEQSHVAHLDNISAASRESIERGEDGRTCSVRNDKKADGNNDATVGSELNLSSDDVHKNLDKNEDNQPSLVSSHHNIEVSQNKKSIETLGEVMKTPELKTIPTNDNTIFVGDHDNKTIISPLVLDDAMMTVSPESNIRSDNNQVDLCKNGEEYKSVVMLQQNLEVSNDVKSMDTLEDVTLKTPELETIPANDQDAENITSSLVVDKGIKKGPDTNLPLGDTQGDRRKNEENDSSIVALQQNTEVTQDEKSSETLEDLSLKAIPANGHAIFIRDQEQQNMISPLVLDRETSTVSPQSNVRLDDTLVELSKNEVDQTSAVCLQQNIQNVEVEKSSLLGDMNSMKSEINNIPGNGDAIFVGEHKNDNILFPIGQKPLLSEVKHAQKEDCASTNVYVNTPGYVSEATAVEMKGSRQLPEAGLNYLSGQLSRDEKNYCPESHPTSAVTSTVNTTSAPKSIVTPNDQQSSEDELDSYFDSEQNFMPLVVSEGNGQMYMGTEERPVTRCHSPYPYSEVEHHMHIPSVDFQNPNVSVAEVDEDVYCEPPETQEAIDVISSNTEFANDKALVTHPGLQEEAIRGGLEGLTDDNNNLQSFVTDDAACLDKTHLHTEKLNAEGKETAQLNPEQSKREKQTEAAHSEVVTANFSASGPDQKSQDKNNLGSDRTQCSKLQEMQETSFEAAQPSSSFQNDEADIHETDDKKTNALDSKHFDEQTPLDKRKRKKNDDKKTTKIKRKDKATTDESTSGPFWLIFSGEYTKAMNKDWHGQHFCCWQCDESLTGQRYVLRDDHPYCVSCYESVFANACEKCSKTIGIDSKDLSYKDKHWHEACFLCTSCGESLVDKQFGSKGDRIYCGRCYDEQFASRCDGCHEIFRAGTKKMEYKTRQWHEKCFCCCVCKVPIGTQSFIPREQEIYCAKCYEEKFATRCIKCNKVITSGGVTYKNEPWHRECFTCTNCSKSLAGERFTSRDEKPYCAECFGELFAKRCYACNKPITGIGGTKFISFEDRHWHNDCFFCAHCRTSLVGRGFITDEQDIICPECAKQKLL